jgi:hypothetical protein
MLMDLKPFSRDIPMTALFAQSSALYDGFFGLPNQNPALRD